MELKECKKCGMDYFLDEKHKCELYPHHGNTSRRIKPSDMGTDYFCFLCPNNCGAMSVSKIRQCCGNPREEGRLIINLKCDKCGLIDARKLWFGSVDKPMVQKCCHRGKTL